MPNIQPWAWTLLLSILAQFCGVVWMTSSTVTRIEALTERVARLERQIDSITNVTRSPRGYNSPPIVP